MPIQYDETRLWKGLYISLILGYCLAYAPYGTNETDGGFLTGLAWQLLNGKTLYLDVVYVRPPLPVWLRALELQWLPDNWALLGERWIFYFKMGLAAWLAAAALAEKNATKLLAIPGFLVSVHCYTPMAWHTVDGIMFGSLACWLLFRVNKPWGAFLSGISVLAAVLCKQSFYPLLPVWGVAAILHCSRKNLVWGFSGLVFAAAAFALALLQTGAWDGFLHMTGASASAGQALQHGLVDYVRINPWYAAWTVVLLPWPLWWWWKGEPERLRKPAFWAWAAWLLALLVLYVRSIALRQDFTPPFAASRLLFDFSLLYGLGQWRSRRWGRGALLPFFSLLALSWCASVSWGYNLPVLMSIPMVWAVIDLSSRLWTANFPGLEAKWARLGAVIVLLAVFRYGYEFVYRDGRRDDMQADMGQIFPAMQGIRSDTASALLYADLNRLAARYGPVFKTLPSFSQASYLTRTRPPLPLDWVVGREVNRDYSLIISQMEQNHPVFFVEKSYGRPRILADPELAFTREVLTGGLLLEESPFFWVIQYPATQ